MFDMRGSEKDGYIIRQVGADSWVVLRGRYLDSRHSSAWSAICHIDEKRL